MDAKWMALGERLKKTDPKRYIETIETLDALLACLEKIREIAKRVEPFRRRLRP
jgi:hypothetical protein